MSVPILVSEREPVVTLTSTSVCESTAESIVVVAIVVIGGITATATVVGSPTKQIIEEPFIPSVLPLFCLSSLPASVTGARATGGKEEPGPTTVTSLAFAT